MICCCPCLSLSQKFPKNSQRNPKKFSNQNPRTIHPKTIPKELPKKCSKIPQNFWKNSSKNSTKFLFRAYKSKSLSSLFKLGISTKVQFWTAITIFFHMFDIKKLSRAWSVKFLYTSLYTWSDLMICFDSEVFPQNFVWQLNNDRKSLDLYYECLK